jgi:hypothetical protein
MNAWRMSGPATPPSVRSLSILLPRCCQAGRAVGAGAGDNSAQGSAGLTPGRLIGRMSAVVRRQCEIIHGRAPGKLFAARSEVFWGLAVGAEQHPHPLPCRWRSARGACALRSLTACACRRADDRRQKLGAVSIARGACAPHCGQSWGSSHRAIGRVAEKGPHWAHKYS